MIQEINSTLFFYSRLLQNKNGNYNKRIGIFNHLVETFFSKIFEKSENLIFEYNLKFGSPILIESVLSDKNFDHREITKWIYEKIECGSIKLKEQYSQQTLDDRAYYYTQNGKLVQGKKNAPNGIEAKLIYPDLYTGQDNLAVPKDPKQLPAQVDKSYIQGRITNQNELQRNTKQISREELIQKQIAPKCKEKNYDYIPFNIPANALGQGSKAENNLKYWCTDNYCNNHRDQLKTPANVKCKNNNVLAKIKEAGWEGFFEFLREQMNSIVGAAVQVVIDIFGGGVTVQFAWFVLLCWDLSRPEKDWLNIFVDIIGVLTFGTGPSYVMSTLKSVGVGLTKLTESEVVKLLLTHKKDLEYAFSFLPTISALFESIVLMTENVIRLFGGYSADFLLNQIKIYKTQILEFIAKLSGETAAIATEKGVEKLAKKAGEEYIVKPMVQQTLGGYSNYYKDASKVIDKTSSVVSKIK